MNNPTPLEFSNQMERKPDLNQHRHQPTRTPSYTLPYPSPHQHVSPTKHLPHPPSSSSTSPGSDASPIHYAPSSPNSYAPGPPSLSTSSISSSSYAGSADGESTDGTDLVALLTERLAGAFDPLQLDRSLAVQAQTSGMLNSKTRELIALQEEAQARLAETKRAFLDGMKIAKEVKSDLDYVHRKVKVLKQKTERKYPIEYNMARDRIPPPSQ